MTDFDVFNGDADGILSLIQLRRAQPRDRRLVTGRKRDINLLAQIKSGVDARVSVLDISMHSNKQDLLRLLDDGAKIFYADHHHPGDIPDHDNLVALIDASPEICTAMIIDGHLEGAYRAWAVAAAFGDNFPKLATEKAKELSLSQGQLAKLEQLGILVNYNGYGAGIEDLHFHPADLYRYMADFDTPMDFLNERPEIFNKLNDGYRDDMKGAASARVIDRSSSGLVMVLEDTASSRRVSGVYGNELAQQFPDRAHAILTRQAGAYVVSVRAPINNRQGADTLCLQFKTGGGRAAAAGINHLPEDQLDSFIAAFQMSFA